jgi:predicted O-methyltransferase YrrM
MKIKGSPEEIINLVDKQVDVIDIPKTLERVKTVVPFIKRQVAEYQGAVLIALANQYNRMDCNILEIGTAWGYSAACLSEGAPLAEITTLNPKPGEFEKAEMNLSGYGNIEVIQNTSMGYWELISQTNLRYDLIFVDGNHDLIEEDLIWWQRLEEKGLMLFHDYSPEGSGRPTPQVFSALNDWAYKLDRAFDVEIIDNRNVGMVGFYKKE